MDKRTLIPLGGLIIIVCFFLPWIRACDTNITGLQLATDEDMGDPIIWLILIIGIVILVGFFALKEKSRILTIISSVAGFAILLWKIFVPISRGEMRELGLSILAGGYGTILGLILALLGELIKKKEKESG